MYRLNTLFCAYCQKEIGFCIRGRLLLLHNVPLPLSFARFPGALYNEHHEYKDGFKSRQRLAKSIGYTKFCDLRDRMLRTDKEDLTGIMNNK